eukprot:RCo025816
MSVAHLDAGTRTPSRVVSSHYDYICTEKLYHLTDVLLSAFLYIRPPGAARYFADFHQVLETSFPEPYQKWKDTCTGGSAGEGSSPLWGSPYRGTNSSTSDVGKLDRCGSLLQVFQEDYQLWTFKGESMEERTAKVLRDTQRFEGYTCGEKKLCLQRKVPWECRLTHLFLDKLGTDRYEQFILETGETGLPTVRFRSQLAPTLRVGTLTISAEEMENHITLRYGKQRLTELRNQLFIGNLSDLYGPESFHLSWTEVLRLESSAKVFVTENLPERFFLEVIGIVSRDDLVSHYHELRDISLEEIALVPTPCQLGQFIRKLQTSDVEAQKRFGFQGKCHLDQVLKQNLVELSTEACVTSLGYFFIGDANQIMPNTQAQKPVLFVAASGVNFGVGSSAAEERKKYFYSGTRRIIPGHYGHLKARVKLFYHLLFTACQNCEVTHPTAIGIGLGIYLGDIERFTVMQLYHEAIFELLCDIEYDFDTFYLNPGPGYHAAESLLLTNRYQFKCKVCLHQKDGKALAANLAKAGILTAYIHPSDFIGVIQGCAGNLWSRGTGNDFTAGEDAVASSTAILARANICSIWGAIYGDQNDIDRALRRIVSVPVPGCCRQCNFRISPGSSCNCSCSLSCSAAIRPFGSSLMTAGEPVFTLNYKGRTSRVRIPRVIWLDTDSDFRMTKSMDSLLKKLEEMNVQVDRPKNIDEVIETLVKDLGVIVVITSLFNTRSHSAHDLLEKVSKARLANPTLCCEIICVTSEGLSSLDRSTLFSMGARLVSHNLHLLRFSEVIHKVCLILRFNPQLCNILRELDPAAPDPEYLKACDRLMLVGMARDYVPKSWAALHFYASLKLDARGLNEICSLKCGKTHLEKQNSRSNLLFNQDDGCDFEVRTRRHSLFGDKEVPEGSTPLYVAVEYQNQPFVELLLNNGASPGAKCGPSKKTTPLQLAQLKVNTASEKDESVAKAILELLKGHESVVEKRNDSALPLVLCIGLGKTFTARTGEILNKLKSAEHTLTVAEKFLECEFVSSPDQKTQLSLSMYELFQKYFGESFSKESGKLDRSGVFLAEFRKIDVLRALIVEVPGPEYSDVWLHLEKLLLGCLRSYHLRQFELFVVFTGGAELPAWRKEPPFKSFVLPIRDVESSEAVKDLDGRVLPSGDTEFSKAVDELVEHCQVQLPSLLKVFWICIGPCKSPKTRGLRQELNAMRSVYVQGVLLERLDFDISSKDLVKTAKKWLKHLLFPNGAKNRKKDYEELLWLQAVVFDLDADILEPKQSKLDKHRALLVWEALCVALRDTLIDIPWVKVLTIARGFEGVSLKEKRSPEDQFFVHGRDKIFTSDDSLFHVFAVPNDLKCDPSDSFVRFREALLQSVTHWVWDHEDTSPDNPDFPYNVLVSARIEEAYRSGEPTVVVSEKHILYFSEMVQRQRGISKAIKVSGGEGTLVCVNDI